MLTTCSGGGGSDDGNGGGTYSGSKYFTVHGKVTTASKKGNCSNGYYFCKPNTCCPSGYPYYCPTSNLCYSSPGSSPCGTGGAIACGATLISTPVAGAHVALMAPKSPGWTLFDLSPSYPSVVTTDSYGNYTFRLPLSLFNAPTPPPFYIAASDSEMSFTLIAEISIDLIEEDADIDLDVTPVTTVAGLWHCPDGDFNEPHYACPKGTICQYSGGAPCYHDPNDSRDNGSLIPLIENEISLGKVTMPDVMNLAAASTNLLGDLTILQAFNNILGQLNLWTIDAQVVSSQISASMLPLIPGTIGGGGNNNGGETWVGTYNLAQHDVCVWASDATAAGTFTLHITRNGQSISGSNEINSFNKTSCVNESGYEDMGCISPFVECSDASTHQYMVGGITGSVGTTGNINFSLFQMGRCLGDFTGITGIVNGNTMTGTGTRSYNGTCSGTETVTFTVTKQ